jgi:uncharacterized membrane protein
MINREKLKQYRIRAEVGVFYFALWSSDWEVNTSLAG